MMHILFSYLQLVSRLTRHEKIVDSRIPNVDFQIANLCPRKRVSEIPNELYHPRHYSLAGRFCKQERFDSKRAGVDLKGLDTRSRRAEREYSKGRDCPADEFYRFGPMANPASLSAEKASPENTLALTYVLPLSVIGPVYRIAVSETLGSAPPKKCPATNSAQIIKSELPSDVFNPWIARMLSPLLSAPICSDMSKD